MHRVNKPIGIDEITILVLTDKKLKYYINNTLSLKNKLVFQESLEEALEKVKERQISL